MNEHYLTAKEWQSPMSSNQPLNIDNSLAQPVSVSTEPDVDHVLSLATIIREVDGNHDKGAVALAEAILSHPGSRWQPREAQPEPVGPTAAELRNLWGACNSPSVFARAVLARYGRPTITPIPVSERLPGAEDCDAEGRCWTYDGKHLATGCAGDWRLRHSPYGSNWSWRNVTHWLPAHALPLPKTD